MKCKLTATVYVIGLNLAVFALAAPCRQGCLTRIERLGQQRLEITLRLIGPKLHALCSHGLLVWEDWTDDAGGSTSLSPTPTTVGS